MGVTEAMKYYEDFGYDNFYDFVDANFHMDKSAVSSVYKCLFKIFSEEQRMICRKCL